MSNVSQKNAGRIYWRRSPSNFDAIITSEAEDRHGYGGPLVCESINAKDMPFILRTPELLDIVERLAATPDIRSGVLQAMARNVMDEINRDCDEVELREKARQAAVKESQEKLNDLVSKLEAANKRRGYRTRAGRRGFLRLVSKTIEQPQEIEIPF